MARNTDSKPIVTFTNGIITIGHWMLRMYSEILRRFTTRSGTNWSQMRLYYFNGELWNSDIFVIFSFLTFIYLRFDFYFLIFFVGKPLVPPSTAHFCCGTFPFHFFQISHFSTFSNFIHFFRIFHNTISNQVIDFVKFPKVLQISSIFLTFLFNTPKIRLIKMCNFH